MDHGFQYICQTETKRLILLLATAFAVVMLIQYFELPYGNVLTSLLSAGKVSLLGKVDSPAGNVSSNFEMVGNPNLSNGLSHVYSASEMTNNTVAFDLVQKTDHENEGKDMGSKNDSLLKRNGSLIGTLGIIISRTSNENLEEENNSFSFKGGKNLAGTAAPENARDVEHSIFPKHATEKNDSSLGNIQNASSVSFHESSVFVLPPTILSPSTASLTKWDASSTPPMISIDFNTSSVHKDAIDMFNEDKKPRSVNSNITASNNNSSLSNLPSGNKKINISTIPVMPISKMNELLLQSYTSPHSVSTQWSTETDGDLLYAKSEIGNASIMKDDIDFYAPIYRNVLMFKRSYELMNNMLKVYIYKEGEKPIFHQSILEGIYASEGWFLKLLETNKHFLTEDPTEAHLFYIPFSSRLLQLTLYKRNSHRRDNLIRFMKNYVDMLSKKYPFWNRTSGADHFLAACHDWAPAETRGHMLNCIRGLCNADVRAGFSIGKDVSIPTTYVRSSQNPLKDKGGNPPSQRSILAFFAGYMHGYVRPILLDHWGKDPDMRISDRLPNAKGNKNYIQLMKSSKYCICARGFAVNSPRVVESIFYECIPVIISDNYVPPLFEVLNWESFALFILEKDIPKLKSILLSISEERYIKMHKRLKKVQEHFAWHVEPVKYDLFHMILHSIWYNRVFSMKPY